MEIRAQSLDWATVQQLDWTPIYEALIEQQMRSLDRPYVYTEVLINCLRMQASVVYAAEDTLSQARASSNLDQLNAVSAFELGQPEPSTGPTFYLNRTTERSVAARRRRPVRQSSSDSQSRHAGTQLSLYRKSAHGQ